MEFVDAHRYLSLLRPILAIVPHRIDSAEVFRCHAKITKKGEDETICIGSLTKGSIEWSKIRIVEDVDTTYFAIVCKYLCETCQARPQAAHDIIQNQLEHRRFVIPDNGTIVYTPLAYSCMLQGVRRMSVNDYLTMWKGLFYVKTL